MFLNNSLKWRKPTMPVQEIMNRSDLFHGRKPLDTITELAIINALALNLYLIDHATKHMI
jgi:hypothetical protein